MPNNHQSILTITLVVYAALGVMNGSLAGATAADVETLRKKLSADLTFSRRVAVEKLGRLGRAAESAVPDLVAALEKDPDEMVRVRSAWALGEIKQSDPKTVSALLTATQDANCGVGSNAQMALRSIGLPAAPQLEEALVGEDVQIRIAATRTLWELGQKPNQAALTAVQSALDDPSPEVRQAAANCAALADADALPLIPKLTVLLGDSETAVREVAAMSLSKVDRRGVSGSALIGVLKQDASKGARRAAAIALGKIGGPAEHRIQALLGALEDQDKDVRGVSSRSLAQLGSVAVKPLLATLASTKAPVRQLCVDALLELGPKAQPAIDPLIGLLRGDPDESVRFRAAGALGAVGDSSPKVLAALEASVAGDKDGTVRSHSLGALRILRPGVPVPAGS